jgi:uncharacterized membrane protein (UPF0127 family)
MAAPPTFDVRLARTGASLAPACGLANSFWTRFKGLMGRPALPAGEGLLIVPCNSVHCFGMKFAIDVLYLSREGEVLRVVPDLAPGAVGPLVRGARAVLELPAGTAAAHGVVAGDRIEGQPAL